MRGVGVVEEVADEHHRRHDQQQRRDQPRQPNPDLAAADPVVPALNPHDLHPEVVDQDGSAQTCHVGDVEAGRKDGGLEQMDERARAESRQQPGGDHLVNRQQDLLPERNAGRKTLIERRQQDQQRAQKHPREGDQQDQREVGLLTVLAPQRRPDQQPQSDQPERAENPRHADADGVLAVERLAQDAALHPLGDGEHDQQRNADRRQREFEPVADEYLPARPEHADQQQRRDEYAHQRIAADGLHELVRDALALSHSRILQQIARRRTSDKII